MLAGETRAAARACRIVDDRSDGYRDLLRELSAGSGRAWLVGVTGSPGVGKSTLTSALVGRFRAEGSRLAVVAVDPTSPFSGGAILGDRIRMQPHFEDPEVFIRSLATRGALGGLSRSAGDVVRVLEAWGAAVILIETVGVGQDELEVCRLAHTTLLVMQPGMGDDVQAVKSGIVEIADVYAVNKADHAGADGAVRDLEQRVLLGAPERPVVRTVATRGEGLAELVQALETHRAWVRDTPEGRARTSERQAETFTNLVRDILVEAVLAELGPEVEKAAERVARCEVDPYSAAQELIENFRRR